ncbi:MAG TPA: MBL fold metallo-hydrolase [Sphingomonadales bacterium]|nr:MBL fold metallo-hydrolase [Sphingomonadales bacterium]
MEHQRGDAVKVETFFDAATSTFTHVLYDEGAGEAAIIDPVLDFDPAAGRISTASAENVAAFAEKAGLKVRYILETHVHADHLSAAQFLKKRFQAKLGIGHRIREVQKTFSAVFNLDAAQVAADADFDLYLKEEDVLALGSLQVRVIETPGHTPACVSYHVEGAVFTGDTLFMPDSGTARCDFPGGDASRLYRSIQKLFKLPPDTAVYLCHDYGAGGKREVAFRTTIAEEMEKNIHVGGGRSEADFVRMRKERDAALSMPHLLLPAIQANMRAGRLPPPEANGTAYFKIPVNRL